MAPRITVKNVLFADDIRQEVTGKHLIVGLYSHDIQVSTVPVNLAIALIVCLNSEDGGGGILHFDIKYRGTSVSSTSGEFQIIEPGNDILPLRVNGLKVEEDGSLAVFFKQDGGDWSEVGQISIKKQVSATE